MSETDDEERAKRQPYNFRRPHARGLQETVDLHLCEQGDHRHEHDERPPPDVEHPQYQGNSDQGRQNAKETVRQAGRRG